MSSEKRRGGYICIESKVIIPSYPVYRKIGKQIYAGSKILRMLERFKFEKRFRESGNVCRHCPPRDTTIPTGITYNAARICNLRSRETRRGIIVGNIFPNTHFHWHFRFIRKLERTINTINSNQC